MTTKIELDKVTPLEQFVGDNSMETARIRDMAAHADQYITNFNWCPPISNRYVGIGIGGVVSLFLYKFERPINGTDRYLWIVEGDLPSAYFVVDDAPDPISALIVYCKMMEDWAAAVESQVALDEVFPVAAAPTIESAEMLRTRVGFIRDRILPDL